MSDAQINNNLFVKIAELIESSRKRIASAVNFTMVYTYFEIGKMIVEDEQKGNLRAEYAKSVLKELSVKLTDKFGRGFSEPNLRNMRKFYIIYSQTQIQQKPSTEFQGSEIEEDVIWQKASAKLPQFTLSWSHYLVLMRIENIEERKFYEIEALKQQLTIPAESNMYRIDNEYRYTTPTGSYIRRATSGYKHIIPLGLGFQKILGGVKYES